MTKTKIKTVSELLTYAWLTLDAAPSNYSFRCLIKFEEFGFNGPDRNHISTGYWWHKDKCFSIDDKDMAGMTPKCFIPLNDDISDL